MKCTVDAKVDTGSPYTIMPHEVLDALDLDVFESENLETVSGDRFTTSICMSRIHIDRDDYVDLPVHIADYKITMPLLGMDILRKGEPSISHKTDGTEQLLCFTFELLPEVERLLL